MSPSFCSIDPKYRKSILLGHHLPIEANVSLLVPSRAEIAPHVSAISLGKKIVLSLVMTMLLLAQLGIYLCIFCRIEAACNAHPTADVFINFASFRRLAIILIILLRNSA
jgi:hypothetical protein